MDHRIFADGQTRQLLDQMAKQVTSGFVPPFKVTTPTVDIARLSSPTMGVMDQLTKQASAPPPRRWADAPLGATAELPTGSGMRRGYWVASAIRNCSAGVTTRASSPGTIVTVCTCPLYGLPLPAA